MTQKRHANLLTPDKRWDILQTRLKIRLELELVETESDINAAKYAFQNLMARTTCDAAGMFLPHVDRDRAFLEADECSFTIRNATNRYESIMYSLQRLGSVGELTPEEIELIGGADECLRLAQNAPWEPVWEVLGEVTDEGLWGMPLAEQKRITDGLWTTLPGTPDDIQTTSEIANILTGRQKRCTIWASQALMIVQWMQGGRVAPPWLDRSPLITGEVSQNERATK